MCLLGERIDGSKFSHLFYWLEVSSTQDLSNKITGTCRYSTFVNWELWWPTFPILVYFKETQTKPEGQIHFFPVIFVSDHYRDITSASLLRRMFRSSSHWLRAFSQTLEFDHQFISCNQDGKQLYDIMVERAGPSKTSGPNPQRQFSFLPSWGTQPYAEV